MNAETPHPWVDVFGRRLEVGDTVIHAADSCGPTLVVCRILKITVQKTERHDWRNPTHYDYPPKVCACGVYWCGHSKRWLHHRKRMWWTDFSRILKVGPETIPPECLAVLADAKEKDVREPPLTPFTPELAEKYFGCKPETEEEPTP